MEKKMLTKTKISSWSDLHPDMLGLIKSRLLARDITTFNMICKPWRSLTPSRVLPPPIDSPLAHTPCLVRLLDNVCEFYHPVYNETYRLECPELSGARIRSSGFGWLLLSQEDDDGYEGLFFFNPFTKERINLPYDEMCGFMFVIAFSAPPTSPDCFVIGTPHIGATTLARVMTIRRGDASWEFLDYLDNGYQKKYLAGAYCSAVILNEKCYFMGDTCNIGVFDVKENTWQVFGEAWRPGLTRPVSMVLEKDGGGLLAVFLSLEREVRLRRFNFSNMVWEVVERLGNDKTLYVSDGTSFLETSAAVGMGNKICFPLFDRGNIGVFYNLSTKKYHSYDGEYCSKIGFNLNEPRSSTWIKPVYAAATDVEELKWF